MLSPTELADLNAYLAVHFQRKNAAPLAEFCGLSPDQMSHLLYRPLGPAAPLRLRAEVPDAALDQVPFLRLTEALLRLVQREGRIKLTATGALPRKFVHELYGLGIEPQKYVDDGSSPLQREADWGLLHGVHLVAGKSGLLKKTHNVLTLTKKGLDMQAPAQRPALLQAVLLVFADKLNWAYFEYYRMNDDETIGQYAWGFSLYLLARFGAELRPTDFYAAKYQAAFPHLLEPLKDQPYYTRQQQFYGNYTRRMHGLFGKWFGLVTIEHTPYDAQTPAAPDRVAATPALRQLFWVVGE